MRAGVVSSRCPEPCPVSATVKVAEKGVCAKMLATCRMRALSSCLPVGLRPTARSPALRSKLNHGSNLQNYELMEALSKAPLTVYSGQIVGKGTMVPRAGKLGSTPEGKATDRRSGGVGGEGGQLGAWPHLVGCMGTAAAGRCWPVLSWCQLSPAQRF